MNPNFNKILWNQFGASLDMLQNAIEMCPNERWDAPSNFWYITYHTLFFTDYYSTLKADEFQPPAPFTLSEFDPTGKMPDRVYSKEEMLNYLKYGRDKSRKLILNLTEKTAAMRFVNEYKNYSILETIIYNMRHIQHHAAQLNLLLRQNINDAPRWVSQVRE